MKIDVTFEFEMGFAVYSDESPGEPFENIWTDTIEEAVRLLERCRNMHPDMNFYIRVSVLKNL